MTAKQFLLVVAVCLVLAAPSAQANSILYWADFAVGTDRMAEALAASSHTVTTAIDENDFVTQVGAGGWDAVVFMNQDTPNPLAQAAIQTWVNGGGRAIFTDWDQTASTASAFRASYSGVVNQMGITILDPDLSSGLINPVGLFNPGWGRFSMGMFVSPGGFTGATFPNGDSAIIVANQGRTIINGFLNDTFVNGPDGVTLYTNELNLIFAEGPAVPEPGTLALLGTGLLALAALRKKRS